MATKMAERLKGKTIVITGASSGIGKSTAIEFARTQPDDLKLILTARREDTLKELAQEIQGFAKGVKVLPVKLDVSKPDEVQNFVGNLPQEYKDIDVLVNNAGLVKGVAQAPDISPADIDTMFSTNVTGLINMTQAILPIFKARSTPSGDIINIGSIAGREPYQGGSIYCATKAAVRSFTDAMRKELITTRIRVIEIDPGQVETEFSVVRFGGDKEKAKKVYEGVEPLTPEDIAEVVVFAAGRRENVVLADSLIFPNHQTSLPLKLSTRLPTKGSVKSLTSMNRATKSDVQGYIVGQYQAVEKARHEHIDRSWNDLQDFIRENQTFKIKSSARAKPPSLAQCMARAGVDNADLDLDSDSEDDEIDLSQKIEHAVSAFAEKTKEYEKDQKEDKKDINTDPLKNNYLVHHPPMLSTLESIDISYPYNNKQNFGIRRHSGGRSLASLIARAGEIYVSYNEDVCLPWSTFEPSSLSSSPNPSSDASVLDLSADDALAMLRERLRIVHNVGGSTGYCRREWLDAKFKTGCSTVHGPSLLRFSTSCYEHVQPPVITNASTATQQDQYDLVSRVRISPSKDTLNTKSSVWTSAFSKCTSMTSISSYQTDRLQSANNERHLHMDGPGMDVEKHERDDKRDRKRVDSLPVLTTKGWTDELQAEDIEQLYAPLYMSAEDTRDVPATVVANKTHDSPLVRERTVDDDVSTDLDYDLELEPAAHDSPNSMRRKWTSRMKHFIKMLPKKSKQATRDCFRATKQFSRTAWNLVPAAVQSRRPSPKIDSVI
ncbi:unnamed protein product [Alternaria alternata]